MSSSERRSEIRLKLTRLTRFTKRPNIRMETTTIAPAQLELSALVLCTGVLEQDLPGQWPGIVPGETRMSRLRPVTGQRRCNDRRRKIKYNPEFTVRFDRHNTYKITL